MKNGWTSTIQLWVGLEGWTQYVHVHVHVHDVIVLLNCTDLYSLCTVFHYTHIHWDVICQDLDAKLLVDGVHQRNHSTKPG
jgi:hypothetical protein